MKYNPDIHHRRSIRLKNYDYSKEGMYFITICTQNKEKLFGEIIDVLNVGAGSSCPITPIIKTKQLGKIIKKCILELSNKYKNIKCDEYVIMPNHIHFIIEIFENKKGQENPAPTIGQIIGSFKFITTKLYNEIMGIKNKKYLKLWQRNYYENIIRNERQYIKVSEYIKNNPLKWYDDKYYIQ